MSLIKNVCFQNRIRCISNNFFRLFSNVNKCPVDLASSCFGEPGMKSLVIMHGLLGSRHNWNSIAKALVNVSREYEICAVDARNHGQSAHSDEMGYHDMAADLSAFIKKRGRSSTVIGHSMGGRAAMLLALTQPQVVDQLIVVDISPVRSSPNLSTMGTYFEALRSLTIPPGTPLSEARKLADIQLRKSIKDVAIRQFLLMNLDTSRAGSLWKANVDVLQRSFPTIATFPQVPSTAQFLKPTLFIAGKQSDYILPEDENGIRRLFPAAQFEYVDGAGHWVHADKPAQFIRIVQQFLQPGL